MNKPKPIKKGNRTTFNYTKEMRKIVEQKQKEEEEKRNFNYRIVMSSIGLEVL